MLAVPAAGSAEAGFEASKSLIDGAPCWLDDAGMAFFGTVELTLLGAPEGEGVVDQLLVYGFEVKAGTCVVCVGAIVLGVKGNTLAGDGMIGAALVVGRAAGGCPLARAAVSVPGFFSIAWAIPVLVFGVRGATCRLALLAGGATGGMETRAGAGAAETPAGADDVLSVLGGTTCTTRLGATAVCGRTADAVCGLAGKYGLAAVGLDAGVLITLSVVLTGLVWTEVFGWVSGVSWKLALG